MYILFNFHGFSGHSVVYGRGKVEHDGGGGGGGVCSRCVSVVHGDDPGRFGVGAGDGGSDGGDGGGGEGMRVMVGRWYWCWWCWYWWSLQKKRGG